MSSIIDVAIDLLNLYRLYTLRIATPKDIEKIKRELDSIRNMMEGKAVTLKLPEVILTENIYELKDIFYRNGEDTVSSETNEIFREQMQHRVRIKQLLIYFTEGYMYMNKNNKRIFPRGDNIKITNSWIMLSLPARIGDFEPSSIMSLHLDGVPSGSTANYKYIIVGVYI